MSAPPSPSVAPSQPPRPLAGREWLAARATLAARRSVRFARTWAIAVGALTVIALLVPFAASDPLAADRARFERLVADTLRTAQRVRRGEGAVTAAESLLAVVRATPGVNRTSTPPRRAAAPSDPAAMALAAAIQEARRLRTVDAWLAVAAQPTLSGGPRMRALADTLAELARQREELPSGPERDQRLAALTQRIGRTGYTILAIADNRLAGLTSGATAERDVANDAPSEDETTSRSSRADTLAALSALEAARDTLGSARRAHDSLSAAVHAAEAALGASQPARLRAAAPAIALGTILVLGLLVRFGSALRAEMRSPTLAHAHEVERTAGAPVVAVVREALLDGPARYRPSGVDPFRMLYLGLTATGTRARTAIVTGSDPVIAAAVGGRLAIAAAADHRTTLVVDLDPREIALARTFRERAEPGFTDALAGAFKWREVARPVGSSDGLPITLLPAGTERDDLPEGDAFVRACEEFTRFRSTYELTILVASPAQVAQAARLVERTPLVHCVTTGTTAVAGFAAEIAGLRGEGHRVHGVVVWEAVRPQLPSRAELAALLSKRKGRTPGGSFEAVKKAVSKPIKGQQ